MVLMAAVSAATAFRLHPLGPLATLAAGLGVFVYAGRPRRRAPRLKDRFITKNLFVAAGIAGFAGLVAVAAAARPAAGMPARAVAFVSVHSLLAALVLSHLILRVFADAVLCDIDDEPADRRHHTRTLPTRMGADRAWLTAMSIRLLLAATLPLWPVGDLRTRIAWAAVTAISTIGLRLWHPRRIRDAVDARFAVEAAVVWLLLGGG